MNRRSMRLLKGVMNRFTQENFFSSSTIPLIQRQGDNKAPETKPDEKKAEEKKKMHPLDLLIRNL